MRVGCGMIALRLLHQRTTDMKCGVMTENLLHFEAPKERNTVDVCILSVRTPFAEYQADKISTRVSFYIYIKFKTCIVQTINSAYKGKTCSPFLKRLTFTQLI